MKRPIDPPGPQTRQFGAHRVTRWAPLSYTSLLLPLAACDPRASLTGLGDELFAPEVAFIEAPGTKLASGRYDSLSLAGTEDATYVLALRHDGVTTALDVIPYDGGARCTVPDAVAYIPPVTQLDATTDSNSDRERRLRFPFFETLDAGYRGRLRFTTLDCEIVGPSLDDAVVPWLSRADERVRYYTTTTDDRLWHLDPLADTPELIASEVTSFTLDATGRTWSIEGGEVVVRDGALSEVLRVGTAVTSLLLAEDDTTTALATAGYAAAFTSDTGVHLIDRGLWEITLVPAAQPCLLQPWWSHWSGASRTLGFYAPCDERRLVHYDLRQGTQQELGPNMRRPHAGRHEVELGGPLSLAVFYQETAQAGSTVAPLWLWIEDREPELLDDAGDADHTPWMNHGKAYYVHATATGDALVEHDLASGERRTLGRDIGWAGPTEALVNVADGRGDWVRFGENGSTTTIARGVPVRERSLTDPFGPGDEHTLLSKFDGSSGELSIRNRVTNASRRVATGVPAYGHAFASTFRALLYIDSFDAQSETGRLRVQLLDTGDTFTVNDGVADFGEWTWPELGLLYTVWSGPDTGLWLARAK